jgi:probable HAF family extracellular repeat protein
MKIASYLSIALALIPAILGSAVGAGEYTIIDLGTLGGSSAAYGINNAGEAVGYSGVGPGQGTRAVLFKAGENPIDLGTLGGIINSAYAINDSGEAVGYSSFAGDPSRRAALFKVGRSPVYLGTLGGTESIAFNINNAGEAVGWAKLDPWITHAAGFKSGSNPRDLDAFAGTSSSASGINNAGEAVGLFTIVTSRVIQRASRFSAGRSPADLGTLGGPESSAVAINDAGDAVGWADLAGDTRDHAVLFRPGSNPVDLGTLGGIHSYAFDINNVGEVVGSSYDANNTMLHAVLYKEGSNPRDLNTFLPPNSGWILISAHGINDSGDIVGVGELNGQERAFLLKRNLIWGAKVNITLSNGSQRKGEFLVGSDGIRVFTRGDLEVIKANDSVIVESGTPLSKIASIALVPSAPEPSDPSYTASFADFGYNMYCSKDQSAGFALASDAYRGRSWNIVKADGSVERADNGIKLYAVPRRSAPASWVAPEARASASADDALKALIAEKAVAKFIPPQIAWAKTWQESPGPRNARWQGLGWNQYGFVTVRITGEIKYREDAAGSETTVVTYDGGIGIGQITGGTVFLTKPGGSTIWNHLWKLAGDTGYNLECAAKLLEVKRQQFSVTGTTFPIGNSQSPAGRTVLEHWFNALWAYNGKPSGRTASNSKAPVYPDQVWAKIRDGGRVSWTAGQTTQPRWSFWNPPISSYAVPSGQSITGTTMPGYTWSKQPTLGSDITGKTAHADVDLDGQVDAVLQSPRLSRAASADKLLISVTTDPNRAEIVKLDSLSATITAKRRGNLRSPLNATLFAVPNAIDVYEATFESPAKLAEGTYRITFSCRLTGTAQGGDTASGITWDVTVP